MDDEKTLTRRKYKVEGMFCAACVKRVEDAAKRVPGVKEAEVNLLLNTLEVTYADGIRDSELDRSLKRSGYHATPVTSEKALKASLKKDLRKRIIILVISLVLLVILTVLSFISMKGPTLANIIVQCVFATLIIGLNFTYYIKGFLGLVSFHPGMETLVSLGSLISYVYSFVLLILAGKNGFQEGQMFYFEGAAMILVMVSIGKLIEATAKRKTTASLEALFSLTPETAWRKEGDDFQEVAISKLQVGDVFRVRAGEIVPADGTIIQGYGYLEQSQITGEPLPKYREKDGPVIGGTLNRSGVFLARVDKVGEEAMLTRIIELVKKASLSKAGLARLSDRVSAWLVPVILLIALITFLAWFGSGHELSLALNMGIAVLVITCPCALSLATPVAMMVGTGKGAENGLLIKSAEAYETLNRIDTLAFDKTGTITTGHIMIAEKFYYGKLPSETIISYVVSLEANSTHPLAITLQHYLRLDGAKDLAVTSYEDLPGYGIKGVIDGKKIALGNWDLIGPLVQEKIPAAKHVYASKIYVAVDGALVAYFELIDTVKKEAAAVMKELQDKGYRLSLISGDNLSSSQALAATLGIKDVHANVKPEEKEAIIDALRKDKRKVAMVGDGVNDALALKSADLAISLGSASDLAIESADVVLMHDDLNSLLDAILLAKKVTKNIRMNLFYAFIYNLIGVPIAAGALYYLNDSHFMLNPMVASMIMALSSLSVVLNALRLRKLSFRIAKKKEKIMTTTIMIEGMKCPKCAAHVHDALLQVDGVMSATVDHITKKAVITHPSSTNVKDLENAVLEAGYRVVKNDAAA